jgi:hypothetical protein
VNDNPSSAAISKTAWRRRRLEHRLASTEIATDVPYTSIIRQGQETEREPFVPTARVGGNSDHPACPQRSDDPDLLANRERARTFRKARPAL